MLLLDFLSATAVVATLLLALVVLSSWRLRIAVHLVRDFTSSQKCQIIHWRSRHRKLCRAKKFENPAHSARGIPEERKGFRLDHQADELPDGSTTFRSKVQKQHKILNEKETSLSSHKAEAWSVIIVDQTWKEQSSMHSCSVAFHPEPSQEAVDAAARTDLRVSEGPLSEELLTLRAELEQAIAERDALSSKVVILKLEIKRLSQLIEEGPLVEGVIQIS